jgi:hypothetical protein
MSNTPTALLTLEDLSIICMLADRGNAPCRQYWIIALSEIRADERTMNLLVRARGTCPNTTVSQRHNWVRQLSPPGRA